jgi:hypothetical protein
MKKLLLSAALLSISGVASANLVQNGSFEANIQPAGTWGLYSSLTDWILVSGPSIELRNNNAGQASDGVNFVELDSTANSAIAQTITTTADNFYQLLFDYSPRSGTDATTNGISVYWNGTLLTDVTGNGKVSSAWTTYSFLVKGTGSDALKFAATGISDSYGGSLDNVRLNAVPLPAALPLMLSGLGALGFAARRRKNSAA